MTSFQLVCIEFDRKFFDEKLYYLSSTLASWIMLTILLVDNAFDEVFD